MREKVKLGLAGLTPLQLVEKAELIVTNLTGNASFPTPAPDLAEVQAAIDFCKEWIQKSAFGDRRAITKRNVGIKNLTDMVRGLGAYVNFAADGSKELIESAGFETARQPEPAAPVTAPIDFIAKRGEKEGEILLNWKRVANSRTYQVEITMMDPADPACIWDVAGLTGRSRFTLENLDGGKMYWFRVKAIGSTESSAYSDVALVRAA